MTKYEVTMYTGIWHNAVHYSYTRDSLVQAVRDLPFQFQIQGAGTDNITEIRLCKIDDEVELKAREKSMER